MLLLAGSSLPPLAGPGLQEVGLGFLDCLTGLSIPPPPLQKPQIPLRQCSLPTFSPLHTREIATVWAKCGPRGWRGCLAGKLGQGMEGASSSLATEVLVVVCYMQYLLRVASSHDLPSEARAFFPKPETPAYGPLRGPGPSNECSCPPSLLPCLEKRFEGPALSVLTYSQSRGNRVPRAESGETRAWHSSW